MDVTRDDHVMADGSSVLNRMYFNVMPDFIRAIHTRSDADLPQGMATSLDRNNYYVRDQQYVRSLPDFEARMLAAMRVTRGSAELLCHPAFDLDAVMSDLTEKAFEGRSYSYNYSSGIEGEYMLASISWQVGKITLILYNSFIIL